MFKASIWRCSLLIHSGIQKTESWPVRSCKFRTKNWLNSVLLIQAGSRVLPRSPCKLRSSQSKNWKRQSRVRAFAVPQSATSSMTVNYRIRNFTPVWAKAEELGAVLFAHPGRVRELSRRLSGNGWLANTNGNPLGTTIAGTTIALSHLIFEGTLDRFPKLKILAAHGECYLPSYADRSDHACFVARAFCNLKIKLKKKPAEYLRE
jgi:predicted TIM-barrel fold metal-dependent hydrolase